MKAPRTTKQGFSLIELLVVCALIAVVATLLSVSASKWRAQASSAQCLNNLRQLAAGVALYCNDHSGRYPNSKDYAYLGNTGEWYMLLSAAGGQWSTTVYVPHAGFGEKRGAYFCPGNPAPHSSGASGWTNYAYNNNLANFVHDGQNWHEARTANHSSATVLFKDAYDDVSKTTYYTESGARWSSDRWQLSYPVHGNNQNVIFTDGHARSVRVSPRPADGALTQGGDCVEMKAAWFWPIE